MWHFCNLDYECLGGKWVVRANEPFFSEKRLQKD